MDRPMSSRTKTTLNARLAELGDAVTAADTHVRQLERDHANTEAEVARLGNARVEAFAERNDALADTLAGERTKTEASVAELAERLKGAHRAVQRAKAEQCEFAAHHLAELIRERMPDAEAAAEAVTNALDALAAAYQTWTAIEADSMALLRLAGQRTTSQPRFPETLRELIRDARRAGGVNVPLPLPAEHRSVVRREPVSKAAA
jgi:hypothetical protein